MSTWRMVFWVAALFNWAAGLPFLITTNLMLTALGIATPADLVFHRLAGLLIVCLGCVYALVANGPARYRPVVWVAVAGKLGVAAIFTQAWMQGDVPPKAFAIALGDLAFGVVFLALLLGPRSPPRGADHV